MLCPACNSDDFYHGVNGPSCVNNSCKNYTPGFSQPVIKFEDLDSKPEYKKDNITDYYVIYGDKHYCCINKDDLERTAISFMIDDIDQIDSEAERVAIAEWIITGEFDRAVSRWNRYADEEHQIKMEIEEVIELEESIQSLQDRAQEIVIQNTSCNECGNYGDDCSCCDVCGNDTNDGSCSCCGACGEPEDDRQCDPDP